MSSSIMSGTSTVSNAELAEPAPEAPASGLHVRPAKESATSPERVGRSHENGYRFGPANWRDAPSKGEHNPAIAVPGESFAATGFELLTHEGNFVSWHACVLDAVDAMKPYAGPCKVVRCSDRVLLKHRPPRRRLP